MDPTIKAIAKRVIGVVLIFMTIILAIGYWRLGNLTILAGNDTYDQLPDIEGDFDEPLDYVDWYFNYISNFTDRECGDYTLSEALIILQGTYQILYGAENGTYSEAEVNATMDDYGINSTYWLVLYMCAVNATQETFQDEFNPFAMEEEDLEALQEFSQWFVEGNYTTGSEEVDDMIETIYYILNGILDGGETGNDSLDDLLGGLPIDLSSLLESVDVIFNIWKAFIIAFLVLGPLYLMDSYLWKNEIQHIINKTARIVTYIVLAVYVIAVGFAGFQFVWGA